MKTTKLIIILGILSVSLLFSGCNLLDVDESYGKTQENAYAYFDNLKALSGHIYSGLNSDFGDISGATREAATDNALFSEDKHKVYDIYNNLWSPINTIDDVWSKYYGYIRSANSFLENYDLEKLERFQYTDNYSDNLLPAALHYPYEVRFLRAYYYFELTKRYGNVPLLDRTYTIDEINTVEKSSFQTIIDFIVSECDAIAPELSISHQEATVNPDGLLGETGRVTRGAAMALKSRALLYAASELHNPESDKAKWKVAAKAALDVINSNWYSLEGESNDPLFAKHANDVIQSKQLIFERRNGTSNSFESKNLPYGLQDVVASGKNIPTQNLVDCYEFTDGTAFDWSNPAHVADPYVNRDPRLYRNVKVNGSTFRYNKSDITLNTVKDGVNYSPLFDAINTGYYMNRYIDPTVNLVKGFETKQQHHYPLIRYAEVLLNYAEAAYEVLGNASSTDAELTLSAETAILEVRNAAGVATTAAIDREYIRDERRRELAFEDHRFWDIRRWKTGEVVKDIYGVVIEENGSGLTYTKEKIQTRTWDNKMYLFPIPINETYINDNLTQNEGWN